MPSTKKTLHFMSSALVSAIAVGVLGFGMSTTWSITTLQCSRNGTAGNANVILELFNGESDRNTCPFFAGEEKFEVMKLLGKIGGAPVVLHGLVMGLLVLCLVFSACSILISLYNSVSNPYETYMGPIGVYTCSSLSACLSVVVLILFVVNVLATNMAEEVIMDFANSDAGLELRDKKVVMQMGYYLVIPYMVLSMLAIVLIYLYEHAAYTHKREQQRPTEDAPKEIMMY